MGFALPLLLCVSIPFLVRFAVSPLLPGVPWPKKNLRNEAPLMGRFVFSFRSAFLSVGVMFVAHMRLQDCCWCGVALSRCPVSITTS